MKRDLREPRLTPVVPGSSENYAGSALRMEDDVFIQAARGLEKSISLLEGFMPFVLLIVVLSGYIVPHLLLQGRKGEYAIMRALGAGIFLCCYTLGAGAAMWMFGRISIAAVLTHQ